MIEDARLHIFGSVAEQVAYAEKVYDEHPEYVKDVWGSGLDGISNNDDVGREFPGGWPDVFEAATSAWAEGEQLLADAMKELKDLELPIPESIRRRQSWSDMDGETVDPARILNGEPYWRFCNRKI